MGDCTEGGVASFAACTRGSALEESTHEFAPELKVLAVPPNLKVANDIPSCEATCELEGNRLQVRRSIDDARLARSARRPRTRPTSNC